MLSAIPSALDVVSVGSLACINVAKGHINRSVTKPEVHFYFLEKSELDCDSAQQNFGSLTPSMLLFYFPRVFVLLAQPRNLSLCVPFS